MIASHNSFILYLLAVATVVHGDKFDVIVGKKVTKLKIKGAAIAYFDETKGMTSPVTRGYGRISSSSSSPKVTPDTNFVLASVSKPFTAAAVAVLVDQGYIQSLDDDICDVISTDISRDICRNPKYPNVPITWREMITHRSSMKANLPTARNEEGKFISPSYGPFGGYDTPINSNPTCPLDGVIDFYHALLTDDTAASTNVGDGVILKGGKELDWYDLAKSKGGMWADYEPGSKQKYSNAAVGMVAGLIELATQESFSEFCRENLFQPLGMTSTAWFREDLSSASQESEAIPVQYKKNKFQDVGHYCYIDYASGQLTTTANDLVKWSTALLNDNGSPELWSKSIGREVVKCQEQDASGNIVKNCEFGYGWLILNNSMKKKGSTDKWLKEGFSNYDWTDGIWHDGAEAGTQTNLLILPEAGVFVAVLTNTDGNSEYAAQTLTKTIVEAPLPSTVVSSPTEKPIMSPVSQPTEKPIVSPPTLPDNSNCPSSAGQVEFTFKILTDKFPRDIKWVLKRNNKEIKRSKKYKKKYREYEESFCISNEGDYEFRINDKYGDGICCNKGDGYYEIYINGELKTQGGEFKRKEIYEWKM